MYSIKYTVIIFIRGESTLSEMNTNDVKKITSNLRVLYAEDDTVTQMQYEMIFKLFFKDLVIADDGVSALKLYKEQEFDIVITDITMPNMDGNELIKEIQKIKPSQHIIVITAHNTGEPLRDSVNTQIDGILIKPVDMNNLLQLLSKIGQYINNEKESQNKKYPMQKDSLFESIVKTQQHSICVAVVDNYIEIVDRFGMKVEKHILNALYQHLDNFGIEEEFIFNFSDGVNVFFSDQDYLKNILKALESFVEHHRTIKVHVDDVVLYISCSFGFLSLKDEVLKQNNELNMYINDLVKKIEISNKSSSVIVMDIDVEEAKHTESFKWLNMTLEAVKQDTIVPFYQPIIDIGDNSIVSYEVFARIKLGNEYILPMTFIDLSEKAGILENLSEIIFKKSYEQFSKSDFMFHINVGDAQWKENALLHYLRYLSEQYNIENERVVLNVTKHENLDIDCESAQTLINLKKEGYKIAFKNVESSLINFELLAMIEPDFIMIRTVWIMRALNEERMHKALNAVLTYVSSLGIKSVLTGVEDIDMFNAAKSYMFDYVQGYFIQTPSDKLEKLEFDGQDCKSIKEEV